MQRRFAGAVLTMLVVGVLAGASAQTTMAAEGRQSYTGTIGGADYRVEVPDRWNGTLVVHNHGYLPTAFDPFPGIALTNRPPGRETETWLLAHGYALAASQFQGDGTGYQIRNALRDQIALLDWFEDRVGQPRHTITTGQSIGAAIALLLAERNPYRFDGVATYCGVPDPQGQFNAALDSNFAVKTLLAAGEDIDLVHSTDPERDRDALVRAIQRALATEEGRARLALIASLHNIPGWYSALQPKPTERAEWIRQQAAWLQNAFTIGLGPVERAELERVAGGNPSWNVGIDYGRQLAQSSQTELVRRAYRDAGVDLRADLRRLAAAPRIAADRRALGFMYRYGVPRGRTPAPILTLHSTGDGGASTGQERWLAEQVRRAGDPRRLRQLYVERGQHCSFNAAEEIVALRTLLARVESGRWPDTSPRRLTRQARALGDGYRLVLDFGSFTEGPVDPAFTKFSPPPFLRPSR